MADTSSDATAHRCKTNADGSASVTDVAQLLTFYEQWSEKYDEDFRSELYVGPRLAAEAACEFVDVGVRHRVAVLDAAAGTGLVGLELSKCGFTSIDAIDASDAMLSCLRQKRTPHGQPVYTRAIQARFGEASVLKLEASQYDVVTLSGGFVPGHLPSSALHDLVRLCKPGGIVIVVMRYEYLSICPEYQTLEDLMERLEHVEGRWQRLHRRLTPNYLLDKQGIVFVHRKL